KDNKEGVRKKLQVIMKLWLCFIGRVELKLRLSGGGLIIVVLLLECFKPRNKKLGVVFTSYSCCRMVMMDLVA
ncbi:hypothetical protein MKW92_051429, partial [Papaver armeniacum]